MRLLPVAWPPLAIALVACGLSSKKYDFEDTEGRTFSVTCRSSRSCDLQDRVTSSATPRPLGTGMPGDTAEFIVPYTGQDRFQTVCESWVKRVENGATAGTRHEACRIVTCTADADCPAEVSMPGVSCKNGLCGDHGRPLTDVDLQHLCLAGTGPWTDTPAQRARVAAALKARPPAVPPECRQP